MCLQAGGEEEDGSEGLSEKVCVCVCVCEISSATADERKCAYAGYVGWGVTYCASACGVRTAQACHAGRVASVEVYFHFSDAHVTIVFGVHRGEPRVELDDFLVRTREEGHEDENHGERDDHEGKATPGIGTLHADCVL